MLFSFSLFFSLKYYFKISIWIVRLILFDSTNIIIITLKFNCLIYINTYTIPQFLLKFLEKK